MPRWLRIIFTATSFLFFFAGSPLIGLVVLPLMRLTAKDREDHRRRCTLFVSRLLRIFSEWVRFMGLVGYPRDFALPRGLEGRPYVMIANHPSLIDMILLMGALPGLTCVTKGSWSRSVVLGPLLRQTHYLPGPGSGEEESDDMLGTMVKHVESGHPLLVFPEGTRSPVERLLRFRRGAVETALRAKVPLVCLFVSLDRPFLMKGTPFWKVPRDRATYSFEILDVIDPDEETRDARTLNKTLHERYEARFAKMLAARNTG
jgi:1-acyl-sn-glycerol-3-phosphate acyltransferase